MINLHPAHLSDFLQTLCVQRIQIITSCTGSKALHSDRALTVEDFAGGDQWLRQRESDLGTLPANAMYTGRQHLEIMRAISSCPGLDIQVKVVSAGYGVIDGSRPIGPYDVTFAGMSARQIEQRGQDLGVPEDIRDALENTDRDLTLVLLGRDYLRACQLTHPPAVPCPTVFFGITGKPAQLAGDNLYQVPLTNEDTRTYRAGLVWLKAKVARLALESISEQRDS